MKILNFVLPDVIFSFSLLQLYLLINFVCSGMYATVVWNFGCHVIYSIKVCCDMVWHIHISAHYAMHEGKVEVQNFALVSCLFIILQ